jgi:hypothetical protein
MFEANPLKFYLAKYILLVVALVLWSIGAVLLYLDELTLPNLALDGLFILTGLFLIGLFLRFSSRLKRVAVGKNKLIILEGHENIRFEWPEIKSLRIVPFFNLCKIKLRGKKGTFYFFVSGRIRSALETLSQNLQERKKKELNMNNPSLS